MSTDAVGSEDDRATLDYAGFPPRLGAVLIDAAVFLPLAAMVAFNLFGSPALVVVAIPVYEFLAAFYSIYLHGRWGQTIGKMCLRIRVVQLDGSRLTWKRTFLRYSLPLLLSGLDSISRMTAVLSVPEGTFELLDLRVRQVFLRDATPQWGYLVEGLLLVWLVGEVVVLVFSEKSRAIHDFIAGTVVVRLPPGRSGV